MYTHTHTHMYTHTHTHTQAQTHSYIVILEMQYFFCEEARKLVSVKCRNDLAQHIYIYYVNDL